MLPKKKDVTKIDQITENLKLCAMTYVTYVTTKITSASCYPFGNLGFVERGYLLWTNCPNCKMKHGHLLDKFKNKLTAC